ncbi:site-specific integrase, partial [Roseomonas indoligenes]
GWVALRLAGDFGHPAARLSGPHPELESSRPRRAKPFSNGHLAIGLGKEFCTTRGISLIERIANGNFLSREELVGFADVCRCRNGNSNVRVQTAYAATRFTAFLNYVFWISEPILVRASDAKDRAQLNDELRQFKRRVLATQPVMQGPSEAAESLRGRYGLDPDQRALLLCAIQPGSPENPWGLGVQHRNQAILATAFRFGLRTGEILSLKVRDFKQSMSPATLTIHRRHDDPEDPRRDQPVAKTLGRLLEVDEDYRRILSDWITEHRADRQRYPDARRHPFMFVNQRGQPLGKGGFRKIYLAMRHRHPSLGPIVNHILRHDWNERWEELSEQHGWDREAAGKDQKYAMGWSSISKMPARYGKRVIQKRSNARISLMQQRATSGER